MVPFNRFLEQKGNWVHEPFLNSSENVGNLKISSSGLHRLPRVLIVKKVDVNISSNTTTNHYTECDCNSIRNTKGLFWGLSTQEALVYRLPWKIRKRTRIFASFNLSICIFVVLIFFSSAVWAGNLGQFWGCLIGYWSSWEIEPELNFKTGWCVLTRLEKWVSKGEGGSAGVAIKLT
jgi:hypothetical protein